VINVDKKEPLASSTHTFGDLASPTVPVVTTASEEQEQHNDDQNNGHRLPPKYSLESLLSDMGTNREVGNLGIYLVSALDKPSGSLLPEMNNLGQSVSPSSVGVRVHNLYELLGDVLG
jgi:hypothetical protein